MREELQEWRQLPHWLVHELVGTAPARAFPAQLLPLIGERLALPSQLELAEVVAAGEDSPEVGSHAHSAEHSISSPLEANFLPHPRSARLCPGRRRHSRGLLPVLPRVN